MASRFASLVVCCIFLAFLANAKIMIHPDSLPMNQRRQLIESSTCASPPYTGSCTASNPSNCPCTSLNDTERQLILDEHNRRRDLAASGNEICATAGGTGTTNCPAGTNMNSLFWDHSLEQIATYWAHQCIWEHHNNEIPG